MSKAPLSGHRIILDDKVFELKGVMNSDENAKTKYYYVLEFIEDVAVPDSSEPSSHSEDFLVEPSEEQQT